MLTAETGIPRLQVLWNSALRWPFQLRCCGMRGMAARLVQHPAHRPHLPSSIIRTHTVPAKPDRGIGTFLSITRVLPHNASVEKSVGSEAAYSVFRASDRCNVGRIRRS